MEIAEVEIRRCGGGEGTARSTVVVGNVRCSGIRNEDLN